MSNDVQTVKDNGSAVFDDIAYQWISEMTGAVVAHYGLDIGHELECAITNLVQPQSYSKTFNRWFGAMSVLVRSQKPNRIFGMCAYAVVRSKFQAKPEFRAWVEATEGC